MLITELFEYQGLRGFGGYGMGYFTRRHYEVLASQVADMEGPDAVRETVLKWLCDTLKRDNFKFNEASFRKASQTKNWRASADFQQRHYYYIAECVKNIDNPAMREFMCNWFADLFKRTQGNFRSKVWFTYCGLDDPDNPAPPKKLTRPKGVKRTKAVRDELGEE